MSDKFVVDTNVIIAANGRNTHASFPCQLACSEFLMDCKNKEFALDNLDLIMQEYKRYGHYSGQPGVGDMFFKYLHDNQHASIKIHTVKITPSNDANRGFEELPENKVDPSDRKFLASAIVAKADIVNATDSDWAEQKALLDSLQITVKQLCPEQSCK